MAVSKRTRTINSHGTPRCLSPDGDSAVRTLLGASEGGKDPWRSVALLGTGDTATARIACTNSAILLNRALGSFASAFRHTASSDGPTDAFQAEGTGTGSFMI